MTERMIESLRDMDREEAQPYLDACVVKHPEMAGWLGAMAARLWGDEEAAP